MLAEVVRAAKRSTFERKNRKRHGKNKQLVCNNFFQSDYQSKQAQQQAKQKEAEEQRQAVLTMILEPDARERCMF